MSSIAGRNRPSPKPRNHPTPSSRRTAGAARPAILAEFAQTLPLRRTATPQDVADAVAWLAGDGSSYVTGAIIRVDGGYAAV